MDMDEDDDDDGGLVTSKGNLLFEGKSMLVKYINLARWRMFDTDDSSDNIVKFLLVSFGGWFHHKAAGDK